ncbi:MAG: response regulator [Deltaproteobacteria bacterium]|nr:response regulator [Deltaproteobacteria bacterium]
MENLLLVSSDKEPLSELASALERDEDVEVSWAKSGLEALKSVSNSNFDLIITVETLSDMTGLELAGKLLSMNPMIHCASVTSLSQKEYHEKSEGLGLMDPLPDRPGEKDAKRLLRDLRQIKGYLSGR